MHPQRTLSDPPVISRWNTNVLQKFEMIQCIGHLGQWSLVVTDIGGHPWVMGHTQSVATGGHWSRVVSGHLLVRGHTHSRFSDWFLELSGFGVATPCAPKFSTNDMGRKITRTHTRTQPWMGGLRLNVLCARIMRQHQSTIAHPPIIFLQLHSIATRNKPLGTDRLFLFHRVKDTKQTRMTQNPNECASCSIIGQEQQCSRVNFSRMHPTGNNSTCGTSQNVFFCFPKWKNKARTEMT